MIRYRDGITLMNIFTDGMILQRGSNTSIFGEYIANGKVTIKFLGAEYSTFADEKGSWKIQLAELKAGGPYEMSIKGSEEHLIKDILIGDVWVCSGQSNMELPVNRVIDAYEDEVMTYENNEIRQFLVDQDYDFSGPQNEFKGSGWKSVKKENVLDFSAVAYFYAKEIYNLYKIPIGLVNCAVGGTPIEAWLGEDILKKYSRFDEDLRKCKDGSYVESVKENDLKRIEKWYKKLNEDDLGYRDINNRWYEENIDDAAWGLLNIPQKWNNTDLEDVNGAVWVRKEIYLEEVNEDVPAMILLGAIVDADEVYINGVLVGETAYMYPPRKYQVPQGILKKGRNLIAIRVISNRGVGGFVKDKPYKLIVGGREVELSGEWKYKVGCIMEPLAMETFFQYKPTGFYNKVVYPLSNYGMKGVIWYQGESNTDPYNDYEELFVDLIESWRKLFNRGEFPFLFVQLANFLEPAKEYSESNWAAIRDMQRRVLKLENTAMAVAIDLGEYNDLHPINKKDVGKRLALGARKMAYGEDIEYSGPIYESMEVEGKKVKVYFSHIGKGLTVKGEGLEHFAVCGEDGKFKAAKAYLDGDSVIVYSDEVDKPIAVRYCWADNPLNVTLYNKDGLPASPFSSDKSYIK